MMLKAHAMKVMVTTYINKYIEYIKIIFSYQAVNFQNLRQQEKFLATSMGKGILLLSLSLIKYRQITRSTARNAADNLNILVGTQ